MLFLIQKWTILRFTLENDVVFVKELLFLPVLSVWVCVVYSIDYWVGSFFLLKTACVGVNSGFNFRFLAGKWVQFCFPFKLKSRVLFVIQDRIKIANRLGSGALNWLNFYVIMYWWQYLRRKWSNTDWFCRI